MSPTNPNPGIPIVIAAPSGAGKTSLVAAVLKELDRLKVSVSYTTRPLRPGEKNGVNYHFVDERQFKEKIAADDFLEHAEVFKHYYGTSKSWIGRELAQGNDVILEIDWQGAEQVRKLFPQALSIFIFPPSLEALEQRLHARGQDDPKIIAQRMKEAKSELAHYHEFDYFITNDDFSQALNELKAIIQANRLTIFRANVPAL